MPKRTDIKRVLVIGSGPIVIGQAAEFDYSGTQACKALRAEGLEVVLINSNPATIMTDPELAEATYVEPLTPEMAEAIIVKEKPDAVLPTVGGQTALNLAVALHERGILDKYNVKLIGASIDAIKVAEDRLLFSNAMGEIGLEVPKSGVARTLEEAMGIVDEVGFPAIIRPSFTLGGVGGGIAYNVEEFRELAGRGLDLSPVHEILVEESVIGWKEFELEVMRDVADNFVVICSIENIDPMGVHTGDSITVAPALTLTDKEYQRMRDMGRRIIRRVGVETGGSNIQFAINPEDGRIVVIEMNPRVSRSSALASKATGFPIAKIAAKLALGYHLDEIPNDITRLTPASFEPTIDYIVVKYPRWNFEKFPQADRTLTTQMKSVGEAMAIGRTFKEAFLKAVRSLELGKSGNLFKETSSQLEEEEESALRKRLVVPSDRRMWALFRALRRGWTVETIHELTKIDPWFLRQFSDIVELRKMADLGEFRQVSSDLLRTLKRSGFSDEDIAGVYGIDEEIVRQRRIEEGLVPAFKRIDTCAAEFESFTPYMYGTYEQVDEAEPTPKKKVVILGSGPNRIGQGIEFDYCCVHAVAGFKTEGFETVMVNCNPETVSTDYDTADRLYFEPLTFEDVMAVIERERSAGGDVSCVVQFGGQTPLKLALPLLEAGVSILGTSPDSIDLAEDRKRFSQLLWELGITQPASDTAVSREEAREAAEKIGYPVVVRPSYVLGGRGMAIVFDAGALDQYMTGAVDVSHDRPVLIDRFLEDAFEFDVDCVADATGAVIIGGIMEHIEEAGIHSGDSSCVVPPFMVAERHLATIRDYTRRIARALKVVGLMNIAVRDQGRHGLRPRSEPALVTDGAVHLEGDGRADGQDRRADRRRPYARRARPGGRPRGGGRVRQEPGVPVRAIPRRGYDPRPGDEVHGRGHGRVRQLRRRVRQGDDQRRPESARKGLCVHQRQQQRQADGAADCPGPVEAGLHAGGDARHGGVPPCPWPRGRRHVQGQRGPAQRRRSSRQSQHRHGDQHPARPRVVLRRPRRTACRDHGAGAVHHDPDRGVGCGQRDSRDASAGADRQIAPGLLRRRGAGSARQQVRM